MKTVYIACPYTKGDVAVNVKHSIETADELARLGFVPFNPLTTHFWHMLIPHSYEFWLNLDLEWVKRCDCILRLPGESAGADGEVAFAKLNNIPVFYSVTEIIMRNNASAAETCAGCGAPL